MARVPPTLVDLDRRRARAFSSYKNFKIAKYTNIHVFKKKVGNINTGFKSHYTGTYPSGEASGELLFPIHYTKYWDTVTCNNPMKWRPNQDTTTQADSGTFAFNVSGAADYVYNYTIDNNMEFIWHTLLWGANQGYPEWLVGLSEADTKSTFDNWLNAIATKYPDVGSFNVLNEVYPGHQSGTATLSAQFGGAGSTGFDWIIYIFERAKHYFPKAVRYINDFGLLTSGTKRQYIIDIAKLLKERDLISGIGIQGHYFNMDTATASEVQDALDDFEAQVDLPIYITEFDLSGHVYSGSYDTSTFSEALQLSRYQKIFPVLYNHKSVERITLWGYITGETWRYDSQNIDTGLINRDGTGKRSALSWLEENYL